VEKVKVTLLRVIFTIYRLLDAASFDFDWKKLALKQFGEDESKLNAQHGRKGYSAWTQEKV
jgi:hypothetical protein